MSIQTIQKPLPGERVVGLSPETATEAVSDWLRRPNLFAGRALSAAALQLRQLWQAGHIAERGQDWVAGVVDGLQVEAKLTGAPGFAGVKLSISRGRGLAVSGEDVVLNTHVDCLLSDLPVAAPGGFFENGSGVGDAESEGEPLRSRVIHPTLTLGTLPPAALANLPAVGVLVLQPVLVDTSNFDPGDPCERSAGDEGTIDDTVAFEDWRTGDGVRLVWYVWPSEWCRIPAVSDTHLRNALAWKIFDAESKLGLDEDLPWECWSDGGGIPDLVRSGVPIALVALDAEHHPVWVDRASVVRQGGRARDARLQLAAGSAGALAANSRLPSLWQAQIEQFAEQVTAAGDAAPADLAQAFGQYLPPVGLLPKSAYEPDTHRSDFFPAGFDVDAAPVPVEQLDLAIRASAGLAPLDVDADESVRVLVPVPLQSWEPRLLIKEVVDAEFQRTLDRHLLERSRDLGARQGLRVRQSILNGAIGGPEPQVQAWNDDDAAVETESLAPWGPPPVGGGHRSVLRAGVHQHYFERATATMPVNSDLLFCWVYLDPLNPPRTLMLQWHAGDWEHRAYWGENLIGWGSDGTTSRARIGDLPTLGQWVRLEVPVASVGLANATVDGMAFTLFDGQAAFGVTGAGSGSGERKWFCNVLPDGVQLFGDEPWELLVSNDLWAPFEPTQGVLPATPALPATTLGAHYDAPADGTHQHFVEGMPTRTAAVGDALFCWVYLDPVNPPREIMLQWKTAAKGWEQRAFWGWNLINWGMTDTVSRFRVGDLPQPGLWLRLEVSTKSVGLEGVPITGIAFTQFDGFAAFGAAGSGKPGTNGLITTESVWFAGPAPAGTVRGLWNVLAASDMRAPTPASQTGQVQAITDLYAHPALQMLSQQERSQLYLLGVDGFANYLKSRADRADDVVDYSFVKVQTDVYRIRQLMLDSTSATRLAVSPALASIAQAETATASQTQIASFLASLKQSSPTAAAPPAKSAPVSHSAAVAKSVASVALAAPQAAVSLGGASSGLSSFTLLNTTPALQANIAAPVGLPVKSVIAATDISFIPSVKASLPTAGDVVNAAPLVGTSFVRTTTIAQRLQDPKSKEARDYSTSSRFEALQSILRLADILCDEDGGAVPGLFDGVDMHGLDGDGFLEKLPDETVAPKSRPLAQFINPATRAVLLPKMLTVPTRSVLGVATDPDESAYFSDSTDLSDHVVAMMRKLEGRIKLYRDAVAACQQVLTGLRNGVGTIASRMTSVSDDLAEARHDVSVARALLAEETQRIADINIRRAKVLADEVKFVMYIRPREADNVLDTPTHSVDPGLIDAPVPACLREHPDLADELLDMLRVVREAPATWFVKIPPLIRKLDRVEHLVRSVQTAQLRAQSGISVPLLTQANTTSKLGMAISQVASRQVEALTPRISALQSINIASFTNLTWMGIQAQAVEVLSFADLADGSHGHSEVAKSAATELQNIRSIVACLHAEFSGIAPVLRLEWAETLSEFDAAPNLRNLASLPRWAEIGYIDRRQMQSYVDWLFAQIEPGQPQAVALMNDVVRMCLLLASHAPVDRIISGRMARPITGVSVGIRIPLTVQEPAKLRVGMQAVIYRGESIVARALVEDHGQLEVSANVIHTSAAKVDLGDDVRIHFDNTASVSLTQASARRTLFGR